MKLKLASLFFITFLFFGCKERSEFRIDPAYLTSYNDYVKSIDEGRVKYLQLAGLFKFQEGDNAFGSAVENGFKLDSPSSKAQIGLFTYAQDSTGVEMLDFQAHPGLEVKTENDSVITAIDLSLDEYGSSQPLFLGDLKWQVITRSGSLYLRVWDKQHPMVDRFNGYKKYDPNPEFIFNGEFSYYDEEQQQEVKSQLGVNATTAFIGEVTFSYEGKDYVLKVGNSGFTMVSDDTSGNETYGGGRYIYLDLPEKDGPVLVDFNKLYNPPCSFSQFTTCLYPPQENHLPFNLNAGEMINRL